MTPDEAHAAAVEEAADAADGLLMRSGIPRTVATEHLGLNLAQHIITVYLASMARAGFVIVPVEATQEMSDAAGRLNHTTDHEIYRAMVAARPKFQP